MAVGMVVLEDLSPLNGSRKTSTWGSGNSRQVFDLLAQACHEVKRSTRVMSVAYNQTHATHTLTDDQGGQNEYDRVVFACPASAASSMLGQEASWLESTLLRGILYHDDDERGFMQATLHNDRRTLPEQHREDILRDAAFVVDVTRDDSGECITEFTHNMAAWPPVKEQLSQERRETLPALLISHNVRPGKEIDPSLVLKRDDYARSHPRFCFRNLIITSMLLPLIQGRRGVYYATNYAVNGNGHDLSCCSGMVAANAIGARYLFEHNAAAKLDFERLKESMMCDHAQPRMDALFPGLALVGLGGYLLLAQ